MRARHVTENTGTLGAGRVTFGGVFQTAFERRFGCGARVRQRLTGEER
jgi:hypothetical protein